MNIHSSTISLFALPFFSFFPSLARPMKHENVVDFLGMPIKAFIFRSQLENQLCSSLAASALKPAEHHGMAS
jgi:hypothetical protein